jgi:hypothetical protein
MRQDLGTVHSRRQVNLPGPEKQLEHQQGAQRVSQRVRRKVPHPELADRVEVLLQERPAVRSDQNREAFPV